MAASPCPMPGVSTMIRSKPAALHAAIAAGATGGISVVAPRVATERKNTLPLSIAFMRMRSPRSAPPPRLRVGSMAMTATLSLSSWSSRMRRSSSSVIDDLPDPPVPVMPSTGTTRREAAASSAAASDPSASPVSSTLMARAKASCEPPSNASMSTGATDATSKSHASMIVLIIGARPMRWPSSGE